MLVGSGEDSSIAISRDAMQPFRSSLEAWLLQCELACDRAYITRSSYTVHNNTYTMIRVRARADQ